MGIRFYCPNGHKLHVKSFQAGMRGICPYCGAKVHIPLKSTRRSTREIKALRETAQRQAAKKQRAEPETPPADGSAASLAEPDREEAETATAGEVAEPPEMPAAETPQQTSGAEPEGTVEGQPPVREDAETGPAHITGEEDLAVGDPIAENPKVVWYVRPPSGGQYGPAEGDILSRWIDEGRVTPDTLVWREGWRDWQEARGVFPQLQEEDIPVIADEPLLAGRRKGGSAVGSGEGSRASGRARSQRVVWTITILVFAVLVLGGVFAYLLWGR